MWLLDPRRGLPAGIFRLCVILAGRPLTATSGAVQSGQEFVIEEMTQGFLRREVAPRDSIPTVAAQSHVGIFLSLTKP